MFGKWQRVSVRLGTELRECPHCFALVFGSGGQEGHQRAHDEVNADPEPDIYEFASGVKVGRPPSALRQVRDIFRLKPAAPEPVKWAAEQQFEDRAQAFRAHMESINGQGSGPNAV